MRDLRPAADIRGVLHTAAAKHGDVGIAEGLRKAFGRGDRVADGGKCLGKVRVAHEPLGKRAAEGRKIPRQHELEQHERDKQRAADGQTQKAKLRRAGGLLFPAAASGSGASLCPRSSAAFSLCARPAAQTHPYGHSLFLPWLSFWDSLCRGIAAYARTQKKSRPPAALAVIRHSGQRNFPKCAVRLGARHSAAPGGTACRRWGATRAQASAHGNFPGKRAGESPSAPC